MRRTKLHGTDPRVLLSFASDPLLQSVHNHSRSMTPVILNVFSTFEIGGPQVRFAALANSSEHRFRQLVFAMDGRYDCFDRLEQPAQVNQIHFDFPRRNTAANVITAYSLLRRLSPALVVTYNWGAIEWALAAAFTNIACIHIVDGFGPEEAEHQLARRVLVPPSCPLPLQPDRCSVANPSSTR